jgi:ATP-binding cassette subfamily F protein 3
MASLLSVQNLAKAYGPRTLFEDMAFTINEGEHVGVIGPNGAGKSTMFKLLTGEEDADSGQVIRSRSLRLGYLPQHDDWHANDTIESYVSEGATLPLWELKALGRGLGLADTHFAAPITSYSGGYRMRAKLLRLLGTEPNLMLLDEPTNYLDLETLLVLERFLQSYRGAFMLISHDREFLRRTTDHILEIEGGEATKYNGNIDDYFEQKELLRNQLAARAMSLEQKKKEILDFVARFGAKATKASQAQSRLKQIDRMETIEIKALPVSARIRIPEPMRVGKTVMTLTGCDLGYETKTVLKSVNLQIQGGDHVAVVGFNGAGKSTLLKTLAQRLKPLNGRLELGFEITSSYFAQHVAEELNRQHTVFQAMGDKAHPSVLPQDVLDLAGALLFSGDDVRKPISVLSGGEKARVALGQILLQKSSCLILDEPTNHLDFQTVEALTQALTLYKGTVITVSHDRGFIRRVGRKILEVRDGAVNLYHGTYDDYVWKLQKQLLAPPQKEVSPSLGAKQSSETKETGTNASTIPPAPRLSYEEKKAREKELRQCERRVNTLLQTIETLQNQVSQLESQLAATNSIKLIDDLNKANADLHQAEEEWLAQSERLEELRNIK